MNRRLTRGSPVTCAVVTVSDVRLEEADEAGALVRARLHADGHRMGFYRIVPDDPERIRTVLVHLAGRVDVVITSGGTGIGRRATTVEVATQLLRKGLPGFGELFRRLYFDEVGASAMLTRALAGVYSEPGEPDEDESTLLFCCPGGVEAVRLALDRLILPELPLLVWETVRQRGAAPPRHGLVADVGARSGEASSTPGDAAS